MEQSTSTSQFVTLVGDRIGRLQHFPSSLRDCSSVTMEWPSSTGQLAALVLIAVVTVVMARRILRERERKGFLLPPGPSPLPLLGNVLSLNNQQPWLTYTEWRTKYGDMIYIRLFDTDAIVVSSIPIATDLLEKCSSMYSDRPFIVTVEPYGHDCNFIFSQYNDRWRLCRRIFQQTFRADAAVSFRAMQLRRARELIVNMIDDPAEYHLHFPTFASSVAMSAVYDYEPDARNDPMVSIVERYLQAAVPGLAPWKTVFLRAFPFLLHVPDGLPGSWIKRETTEACAWRDKMIETPYKYVQERMASKEFINTAMVPDHISRMEKLQGTERSEYEKSLKHASATAFLVSTESTSSTLMVFTLAMVQNPHIWKRAQADIDAVVGTDRLPDWNDRPSLTYIDAILRETIRWKPVVPLLMHATTRSDIYNGYYIPKGTSIIVNSWAMSRDEDRYPDAEKFIPERFLNAEGMITGEDPSSFIFGFGRRKCPGRYSADASLWSAMVTMLATFEFHLAKDADGNEITFEATFTNGMINRPNDFPCRLTPRPHVSKDMVERILAK